MQLLCEQIHLQFGPRTGPNCWAWTLYVGPLCDLSFPAHKDKAIYVHHLLWASPQTLCLQSLPRRPSRRAPKPPQKHFSWASIKTISLGSLSNSYQALKHFPWGPSPHKASPRPSERFLGGPPRPTKTGFGGLGTCRHTCFKVVSGPHLYAPSAVKAAAPFVSVQGKLLPARFATMPLSAACLAVFLLSNSEEHIRSFNTCSMTAI